MKDRLASVGGQAVSYAKDSSICQTSWDGINYTFEGRRLVGYGVPLTKTNIAFAYNDRGLRTKKVVSKPKGSLVGGNTSTTTEYFYDGDKLIVEKRGENIRLDYLYDENGSLYGFVYNKTDKYFYVRDVLQNILGIIDSNGTLVVRYKYNAWGKKGLVQDATQIGIGEINPFRFKGYYYDTETGMYYCQSRYYVPEWGRWLNGDSSVFISPQKINGFNLFAYCSNDPINAIDAFGNFAITISMLLAALAISSIIGALGGFVSSVIEDSKNGKVFDGDVTWRTYLGRTLGGGIAGAGIGLCTVLGSGLGFAIVTGTSLTIGGLTVSGFGAFAMAVSGAGLLGGLGYAVRVGISDKEEFQWENFAIEAISNAFNGVFTFASAMTGGVLGIKVPGAGFSLKNLILYQLTACLFGTHIIKAITSYIKKKLKERF